MSDKPVTEEELAEWGRLADMLQDNPMQRLIAALREARSETNNSRTKLMDAMERLGNDNSQLRAKLAEIRAVVNEQLGADIWHAPGIGIYENMLRRLHEVIGE